MAWWLLPKKNAILARMRDEPVRKGKWKGGKRVSSARAATGANHAHANMSMAHVRNKRINLRREAGAG